MSSPTGSTSSRRVSRRADGTGRFRPARAIRVLVLGFGLATAFGASASGQARELAKLLSSDLEPSDRFGTSVGISGRIGVVGAPHDDDLGNWSGSAYVFESKPGSTNWREVAKLGPSDGGADFQFGERVAISGTTVAVGACGADDPDSQAGAVYVFERGPGYRQPWTENSWTEVAKLTASDAKATDFFCIVALNRQTMVIGAPGADGAEIISGAVYVFERDAVAPHDWLEVAKLTASDGETGDRFGLSVAVSGRTVVVGAPFHSQAADFGGAMYAFQRAPSGDWQQVAKFTPPDLAEGDRFGWSVAVSAGAIAAGSPHDSDFGWWSGSAHIVEYEGVPPVFGELEKITPLDSALDDHFGYSVGLTGARLIVGALNDDDLGSGSGSAYIFAKHSRLGAWQQAAKLVPKDGDNGDAFGNAVAADGSLSIVGAFNEDSEGSIAGASYIFRSQ